MNDTRKRVSPNEQELEERHADTIAWLEDEFPGWHVEVAPSTSWVNDELEPVWIARKDDHHPQAERTAAKLHTRLSEYLEREARRQSMSSN